MVDACLTKKKRVWGLEQSWRIFSSHVHYLQIAGAHAGIVQNVLSIAVCVSVCFLEHLQAFLPSSLLLSWWIPRSKANDFSNKKNPRRLTWIGQILYIEQMYHVFNKLQREFGSCSSKFIKNLDTVKAFYSYQCSSMATPLFRDHAVQTLHSND